MSDGTETETPTSEIDTSALDQSLANLQAMSAANAEFQVGVANESIKMNAYNKVGQKSGEVGK